MLVGGFFISLRLQMQAFDTLGNKKPGELSSTGLLAVDYTFELSNLDFLSDIIAFVDYRE